MYKFVLILLSFNCLTCNIVNAANANDLTTEMGRLDISNRPFITVPAPCGLRISIPGTPTSDEESFLSPSPETQGPGHVVHTVTVLLAKNQTNGGRIETTTGEDASAILASISALPPVVPSAVETRSVDSAHTTAADANKT